MINRLATAALIVLWFVILTIGFTVEAADLSGNAARVGVLFVLSSTITNVGILAIVASVIGEPDEWAKSIRRGFTIYVGLISGVLVLFTESISMPTPGQYAKIAGTVSLICVVCSYKPELFDSFIDRITAVFKGHPQQ